MPDFTHTLKELLEELKFYVEHQERLSWNNRGKSYTFRDIKMLGHAPEFYDELCRRLADAEDQGV